MLTSGKSPFGTFDGKCLHDLEPVFFLRPLVDDSAKSNMTLSLSPVVDDDCQIDGVSFSHLVTNHCVTRGRLAKLLGGLSVIHTAIRSSNGTVDRVDYSKGGSEYVGFGVQLYF